MTIPALSFKDMVRWREGTNMVTKLVRSVSLQQLDASIQGADVDVE
jgi:hypothetical protein